MTQKDQHCEHVICYFSSDNPVDNSVEKAVLFLQQQIDGSTKAERPMRGPYLAQLELMKRLKEQANPEVEKLGMEKTIFTRVILPSSPTIIIGPPLSK